MRCSLYCGVYHQFLKIEYGPVRQPSVSPTLGSGLKEATPEWRSALRRGGAR
jgi:hypothetical protein